MNEIGNAEMGILQLDRDVNELKIVLDKVFIEQGYNNDLQLLTINLKNIDI